MNAKINTEWGKPFCPVDAKGEIVKKCSSVEDLSNFVLWLNLHDESSKKQKKKAFAIESKKLGILDEALSKCSLVEKVAGDFFNEWLVEINAKALTENELGHIDRPYNQRTGDDLRQARGIFKGLLRSLQEEMFGSVLIKADMEPEAVADLTESLVADSKTLLNLTSILKDRVQKDMEKSLDAYWASEKSRHDIKREKVAATGDRVEKWGMYAPLVKYMTKSLGPAQAAEFMTRFDLYVRSGWALKDLTTQGKDQTPALATFNAMLKDLDLDSDPSKVNGQELEAAVVGRFSELFLPIKVKNDEEGPNKSLRSAMAKIVEDAPFDGHGMAKSGFVDAAILAADGKRLFLGFSTSDEHLSKQKDQWIRHFFGVTNAIKEGVFEENGIPPGLPIDACVIAPCVFGIESNFGSSIYKLLFDKVPDADGLKQMNMALPLSALLSSGANPSEFPLFDFKLAGDAMSSWRQSMALCKSKPNEAELIGKKAVCEWISKRWSDFENLGWAEQVGFSDSSLGRGGFKYLESLLNISSVALRWAAAETDLTKVLAKDKTSIVGFSRCLNSMRGSENLVGGKNLDLFESVEAKFEKFVAKQAALKKKPKRAKSSGVDSDSSGQGKGSHSKRMNKQ